MKIFHAALFATFAVSLALAQGTRLWKENTFEEFERGTAKGVAIQSTGVLTLAPAFKTLNTTASTFIWSVAADKNGNVYAATGSPARLYRITPEGTSSVIFEPKELQVQAVALGKDGAVYAATSPDGKIYKLTAKPGTADFTAAPFFDPKTKYIWDIEFNAEGRLYVATGDNGEIYRVDANGHGAMFFKSDEAHIRVLAFDPKGNLIAGSDSSGLIYRISPAGEGFVLYSTPKKEITALAVDAAGNIYAAGAGEKRPSVQPTLPVTLVPGLTLPLGISATALPLPATVSLAGSEVYMIAPDGAPRKLWSSREDIVYALAFDSAGHLLAGTGNKGRIYSIDKTGAYTDLVKASASQVTGFAKAPGGSLYCSTSNLGKIFILGNGPGPEGVFDSDVQDAHNFSRWGRAEVRGSGSFEIFAHSGNVDNPDRNWSAWSKVDLSNGAKLQVPPARFVQWRAVLKPAATATQIFEVAINYLSRNVAPVVDDVVVQTGARFQPLPHIAVPEGVTINVGPPSPTLAPRIDFTPPVPAVRDRSSVAVRWTARDDNDDELTFSLFYRGEDEQNWKLLKAGVTDKFYSFDSGLLPDGGYVVRVVASDARSHTPEDALSGEKESQRFEIDNTPPRILDFVAKAQGQQLRATFRAVDDFSPIKRAEYSVDAGEWQYVEPVGQISDSKSENYDFSITLQPAKSQTDAPAKSSSEHVVVVRVYDRYDNMGTAKSLVR